ncbi:MAG: type VII secretion protein EssC [Candidatus Coprovivens sp.]
MKITLYYNETMYNFKLPNQVSGSFSFDVDENSEKKLINIEARKGKWVLYSTDFSKIVSGGIVERSIEVEANCFYTIQRDKNIYLILITELYDKTYSTYAYNGTFLLSNLEEHNNFNYEFFVPNVKFKFYATENFQINIETNGDEKIYLNNLIKSSNPQMVQYGDVVEIYGLNIYVLKNFLLINNPNGTLIINEELSGLKKCQLPIDIDEKSYEEIQDIDMYSLNDYYSKSPRIRRQIEEKDFNIENPPMDQEKEELPALLTLAPMATMVTMAIVRFSNVLSKIVEGTTTLKKSWVSLLTSTLMLASAVLWPSLTRAYQKRMRKHQKIKDENKYITYMKEVTKKLDDECLVQRDILTENLFGITECLKIMNRRGLNFWDKRIDQNDLLVARIGVGDEKLQANIHFSDQPYNIDKTYLRTMAEEMVEEHKILTKVPIGYSFSENKTTAIMGNKSKTHAFVNNILLQFMIFYSYDDLKFMIFTDKEGEKDFEYLKYLNHTFSNDKTMRFFSSDEYSARTLADRIITIIRNRYTKSEEGEPQSSKKIPYYLIIVDGMDLINSFQFDKVLTEIEENLGISMIIIENRLPKLPSKCNNFILLGDNTSNIMTNSYNKQETQIFYDEVEYGVNMMSVAKYLSNIPVEIKSSEAGIPQTLTFLEMEKVGKVEQLNILERWKNNNSTQSLKANIGIGSGGELISLDLHEKYHGPHGLIAGTTGSGKSEFIITYILSMAINYSPDDIAFILIDYKGGGLAYAFENESANMILPHLTGTITNLDKSEMDRTLVSIDSEVKRRQKLFNIAREKTGESTIDIYKYQQHFHNGELDEPCPHLFIICDEFAELKAQQPEFMNDLISIARIGRSLGVHLILATQKPSGQVSEQIWTNTKFRVCLKVQNAGDSREMLKRPEAAFIKEAGRFYLQVGNDEIFVQAQSGWAGAKYVPSDTVVKDSDKSINIINETGTIVKSIKAGNSSSKNNENGEQLAAILKNIIEVADMTNKKAKRLWLPSLPPVILLENLIKKYKITHSKYNVKAIIGEYDAPESQQQGLLELNVVENENTLIYGINESEREFFLKTILYSIFTNHDASEINFYIIDYGSASLGVFSDFPQVGEVTFVDEEEKFKNTLKLIKNELKFRKKEFMNYGGDYKSYLKNAPEKLPAIVLLFNNYDSILEIYKNFNDTMLPIIRECSRYGIYIWLSLAATTNIGRRSGQYYKESLCLHMKDDTSYRAAVVGKSKLIPKEDFGRGLINNGSVHEFQTATIIEDSGELMVFIRNKAKELKEKATVFAKEIKKLPKQVTFDYIKSSIKDLSSIPVGVYRDTLDIATINLNNHQSFIIGGYKIEELRDFTSYFIDIVRNIKGTSTIFVDIKSLYPEIKTKVNNYFDNDVDKTIQNITDFIKKRNEEENPSGTILLIFYGIQAIKDSVSKTLILDSLTKEIKKSNSVKLLVIDGIRGIKTVDTDMWYTNIKNTYEGLWIGRGLAEQTSIRLAERSNELSRIINNKHGYNIVDQIPRFIKLINFSTEAIDGTEEDSDDEE